jgi:hypothetical protein
LRTAEGSELVRSSCPILVVELSLGYTLIKTAAGEPVVLPKLMVSSDALNLRG